LNLRVCRTLLLAAVATVFASSTQAADKVTGKVTVAGKPVTLRHGFAEADSLGTKVVLCDAVVPGGSVKAQFERRELAEKGKAHCVENTIDEAGKVVTTSLLHDAFKGFPSGVSSWMVFVPGAKSPGRIRGRIRTTEVQHAFDETPYTWDVTFDLALPVK
jgi:hypothetical protein